MSASKRLAALTFKAAGGLPTYVRSDIPTRCPTCEEYDNPAASALARALPLIREIVKHAEEIHEAAVGEGAASTSLGDLLEALEEELRAA